MNYGPQWEALLDQIDEFLEGQEDIRDGSDGKQLPNEAMSLLTSLRYLRPVARPEAEAFKVIFHNIDSNGDPIGAQPESAWEHGHAAGLRYAYRVLKGRGVDLPSREPVVVREVGEDCDVNIEIDVSREGPVKMPSSSAAGHSEAQPKEKT